MAGSLNALLQRFFRDGDAASMETIVARTRRRLLRVARRIGAPQDAEDAVQTAYHSLLRRGRLPADVPVEAWLVTAVVRIAYRRDSSGTCSTWPGTSTPMNRFAGAPCAGWG